MDHLKYTFFSLEEGDTIEVSLSRAANACLMDLFNYSYYTMGLSFRYYGGYVTYSPSYITVPYSGTWYLAIDLGGHAGSVSASVRVIKNKTHREINIEPLKWQIQEDNPDCIVKVTSNWLEKHPEYGDPNTLRTDFLVFDKKTGNLHKHYSIGEDTNWELKEWHDWR